MKLGLNPFSKARIIAHNQPPVSPSPGAVTRTICKARMTMSSHYQTNQPADVLPQVIWAGPRLTV
jgi:hypothetical protein